MSIINKFKTEKELLEFYLKNKYFTLKCIFNDYWYEFLKFADKSDLNVHSVVKTPFLGCSTNRSPNCGTMMDFVYSFT